MTTELHLNIRKKIFVIAFLITKLQKYCAMKIWCYMVVGHLKVLKSIIGPGLMYITDSGVCVHVYAA